MEGTADGGPGPMRRDRDNERGGGYVGDRSGPRENYNRPHNQYGDRHQQGQYQRGRGPYRSGHGSFGSFAQQQEGFTGNNASQQHQGYPRHEQREQHPGRDGFRGSAPGPHFDAPEARPHGFMNYGQEQMMGMPARMAMPQEYWAGAGAQFHHAPVAGPAGMHGPFPRLALPRDQAQYPVPQPYLQPHQVAGGHQGTGPMGIAAGPPVGGAAGAVLHGPPPPMYHPSAPRVSQQQQQHSGVWGFGGQGYRNVDAGRAGAGGRGAGAARNAHRAPHVPQPIMPNAASRTEPATSGMNSLGRPRQQPLNTVSNVQPARPAPADTAPAPAADGKAVKLRPDAGAEAAILEDVKTAAAAATPAGEAWGAPAVDQQASDGQAADAASASGFDAVSTSGTSTVSAKTGLTCAASTAAVAAVPDAREAPAAGASQDAAADGCVAPPAPLSPSPEPPASPQRDAMQSGPAAATAAEKLPAAAGGSAWKQQPSAVLSAGVGAPQGAVVGASGGAGAGAVSSWAQLAANKAHVVSAASASAAAMSPTRPTKMSAPVQSGAAQHPRCPPPGFGASPAVSPAASPADASPPPSGQGYGASSPTAEHSPPPPGQQQVSPPADAEGDAVELSVGSPVGHAVPQQQPPKAATPPIGVSASPNATDVALASTGPRNWASVAAARGSSGGAPARSQSRRQTSEVGSSIADPCAAAAAVTLVGLRHAVNQPPGFAHVTLAAAAPPGPVVAVADAPTGDIQAKAAGRPDGTGAALPGALPVSVSGGVQAGAAKDGGPAAGSSVGAPSQPAQQDAVPGGPAVAAAAVATALQREPAAGTAPAPAPAATAVLMTSSPGSAATGQGPAANGAAAVLPATSPAAEAPVLRTWAHLAARKDARTDAPLPRPAPASSGNAVPALVLVTAPGPTVAAGLSPTPAHASAVQPQQAGTEAVHNETPQGCGAANTPGGHTDDAAAAEAGRASEPAAAAAAAVEPEPAATAASEKCDAAGQPAATPATSGPADSPAPAPAAPVPRTWAALAAAATSRPHASQMPPLWRARPGGIRHSVAGPRGTSALPPEDMFQNHAAATAPMTAVTAAGARDVAGALAAGEAAAGAPAAAPPLEQQQQQQQRGATPAETRDSGAGAGVQPEAAAPLPRDGDGDDGWHYVWTKLRGDKAADVGRPLTGLSGRTLATLAEAEPGAPAAAPPLEQPEAAAPLPRDGDDDGGDDWHYVWAKLQGDKDGRAGHVKEAHTGLTWAKLAAIAASRSRCPPAPLVHHQHVVRVRAAGGTPGTALPAAFPAASGVTAAAAPEPTGSPAASPAGQEAAPTANDADRAAEAAPDAPVEPAAPPRAAVAPTAGAAPAARAAATEAPAIVGTPESAAVSALSAEVGALATPAATAGKEQSGGEAEVEAGSGTPPSDSPAAATRGAPGETSDTGEAAPPTTTTTEPQPKEQQQQQQPPARAAGDSKGKKASPAAAAVAAAVVQATRKGAADEDEDEAEEGTASIPAGNNPWDLLGAAGEDGTVAAVAAAGGAAVVAAAEASGGSGADLMDALRQLLMPVAAEQLAAAGRPQRQQAGGLRIQPRGLANTGNTCFINSTMQALLGCAPFAAVLSRLPAVLPLLERSKTPTLYGLAEFSAQLAAPQGGGVVPGDGGAGGRQELHAAEDEGWAEVPSGRGKKGPNRKSTSAYPGHHPGHIGHTAAPAASSAAAGGATASMAALLSGKPLVPSMLNPIVAAFNPRISIAPSAAAPSAGGASGKPSMVQVLSKGAGGRSGAALVEQQEQQDAQEFFQFLVNRAHEEVVALRKAHGLAEQQPAAAAASGSSDAGGDDGEEWAQVGRRNRATVTRQVGAPADDAASRSPVSAIFSGSLKSTVRFQPPHAAYKPSATIEPFNMLHLDIAGEGVASLEDALRQHSVPENIEYKPDGATQMLPAKKDVRLYRLPECLVLHLKRFTYTTAGGGGYCKLHKLVAFGCSLRLEGKILAEDCPDRAHSEYRLFATVIHHGRNIAGGHYTADVLQPDSRWLRFNDAEVSLVSEAQVLAERPYLLFYQRVQQQQQH